MRIKIRIPKKLYKYLCPITNQYKDLRWNNKYLYACEIYKSGNNWNKPKYYVIINQ